LRSEAVNGKADALLTYVYFCAWQGIRADRYIPNDKKASVFRHLVKSEMIEVSIAPTAAVPNNG
jgi:hypothetical protein